MNIFVSIDVFHIKPQMLEPAVFYQRALKLVIKQPYNSFEQLWGKYTLKYCVDHPFMFTRLFRDVVTWAFTKRDFIFNIAFSSDLFQTQFITVMPS